MAKKKNPTTRERQSERRTEGRGKKVRSAMIGEAELLAKITQQNVKNFIWKSIVCKFGYPEY